MATSLTLLGLDVGTTTTHAVVATAEVARNAVTGRPDLTSPAERYRSPITLTPYEHDALDVTAIEQRLDGWLREAGCASGEIAGGGVLITGLAAQGQGAAMLAERTRVRLPQCLIARAADPGLESWLAFMGNCRALSQSQPDTTILNLDIGGGTTNLAWGRQGRALGLGSYFLGARHVLVAPGGYRIIGLSGFAQALFASLRIDKTTGQELAPGELKAILDFYAQALESLAGGLPWPREALLQERFTQLACGAPPSSPPTIVLSGGVGELSYRLMAGEKLSEVTPYGDLGVDFARRLCESPLLSKDLQDHRPPGLGRATVCGLALHGAQLSGATLYIPRPNVLPLADVPIVGSVTLAADEAALEAMLRLAIATGGAAALEVSCQPASAACVTQIGRRLAAALRCVEYPSDRPLVLLAAENVGKTLGHYSTDWGRLPVNLLVIDETPLRGAEFVSLGRPCDNAVLLALVGLGVLP